jgi:hypothetical protein
MRRGGIDEKVAREGASPAARSREGRARSEEEGAENKV